MSSLRPLIVTGATGKQGGALISALLAQPTPTFEIFAVTRNKTSGGAQRLASKPNVKVIEGSFDEAASIFKQVPRKPWGLFLVTVPEKGAEKEEQQGRAMVSAALDAGIQHILYTSVKRDSEEGPTSVPHFASKYRLENFIKEQASSRGAGTTWTFLRPVAFNDNFTNNFFGKVFVATWRLNGVDRKLQFISTSDIGRVGADALLNVDSAEYRNQAIPLAGDDISPNEAKAIFKEVTNGQELPDTFSFFGVAVKLAIADMRHMMNFFKDVGYGVDVQAMRKRYPFIKDFRAFLREESAWKVQQ